jgi:hypothetical protein
VISQTAIRSESCRLPDRVMLLADMKVLQRITDSLRDWLDEWKGKEPEAEAPMMWDGEPITASIWFEMSIKAYISVTS